MERIEVPAALVTSSSHGIGRVVGVGVGVGAQNCDVAVTYLDRVDSTDSVVDQIRSPGRRPHAYQVEGAEPEQLTGMRTAVEGYLGPVEILVNNAGKDSAA
jgi:NAD(P)-dependent dehydrogenase (short-subunit alcohol dehydrogenase family)